ncbi:1-acyl-sn-glycerol-3-phosphate acyltransferase [Helcococcus ovis]|uniref:1-acyl-sn-glycerol-3-phosphate acyltransferase n=2 Tax=Helcococcus ovis TaxID=72026 RepID=A0A4R9C138_9FIRM|nr:lysophospholipid acyltransferase family protein [Helcococcus ovis]TFF64925.1 1-acyl-sn-glycerol-3-phosphate acyltransferase [Helcococcus ovis]
MLYKILRFIARPILKILTLYKIINKPKVIPDGNIIICSNHKSLLDPFLLILAFDRNIKFIAKKELFKFKPLGWFLRQVGAFPVDRKNNDIDAVKKSIEILKNNDVLGIFPEGTRIKSDKDVKRENFNNGIAMIALRSDSNIIPIEIKGKIGLFSKPKIIFKELIHIDDYKSLPKKDIYRVIVDKEYNNIYN